MIDGFTAAANASRPAFGATPSTTNAFGQPSLMSNPPSFSTPGFGNITEAIVIEMSERDLILL